MLKHRLADANRSGSGACWGQQHVVSEKNNMAYNEELFVMCMRRFLYVRCYDSLEFLSILKTLHFRIRRKQEAYGIQESVLMIDSIGAFHWMDRLSSSLALGDNNRKSLSLQNVTQTVVEEIKKLLLVHPMLVIATKATILGDRYSLNESKWKSSTNENPSGNAVSDIQQLPFREFMPSAWQSLVTHRILVRPKDDPLSTDGQRDSSTYVIEWLLPQLSSLDIFTVNDARVGNVS